MADISMCREDECPRREACWRYLAPPDKWQSYIKPEWGDHGCDLYWPLDDVLKELYSKKKTKPGRKTKAKKGS